MAATSQSLSAPDSAPEGDESVTHQKLDDAIQTLDRTIILVDLLLQGPKSKHYGWVMDLSEALRGAVTTPFNLTFSFRPGARGYHSAQSNTLHQMLTLLRDAMLHMRYAEAIEILKLIVSGCRVKTPLALETAIYRSGLEVMYSVSDLAQPPLTEFLHQLKLLTSSYNPQKLVVEQFVHILLSGCHGEALECISSLPKVSPKVSTSEQGKYMALLYRAYSGLIHYLEWEKLQKTLDCRGPGSQISTQQFNRTQQCKLLAEQALEEFAGVTDKPGVWDAFVCCQVRLLEYLRSDERALEVLVGYKSRNEESPNAHRYLIDLYKHRHRDAEKLKALLTEFCGRWPSDRSGCLDLVELLDVTSNSAECRLAVTTYFSLLDYSCHTEDLDLWKRFKTFLSDVSLKNTNNLIYINVEWKERETWWKPYHFTNRTTGRATELFQIKYSVYKLLTK